jgi:hypothetical protein
MCALELDLDLDLNASTPFFYPWMPVTHSLDAVKDMLLDPDVYCECCGVQAKEQGVLTPDAIDPSVLYTGTLIQVSSVKCSHKIGAGGNLCEYG